MATSNEGLEIVKQLFSTLSADDKKSFLKSIKSKEKSEQNFTFTKEIKDAKRDFKKIDESLKPLKNLFIEIIKTNKDTGLTIPDFDSTKTSGIFS